MLFLGLNRHITKTWCMIPKKYHGLGMPNFFVYYFADKVFLFQRHLGFLTAAGNMIDQGFKAFQMKVDLYGDILALSFEQ